jgi:predicted nucleic acid-binding protein
MNAVDTNILLYARDPRDQNKQQIAADLIQSLSQPVLIWQVACEYVAASRKLQTANYGPDRAWFDVIRLSRLWPLQLPTSRVLKEAQSLNERHSLSVWDALLVAACLEAGVTTLYTEDLQDGLSVDRLKVVNPFL